MATGASIARLGVGAASTSAKEDDGVNVYPFSVVAKLPNTRPSQFAVVRANAFLGIQQRSCILRARFR